MARLTRFRQMFGLEPRRDVDAELAFHIEMRVRELIDGGETPERARHLALQRFGNYDQARRECVAINERRRRRMVRADFFAELRQDIGYAFRMMRRAPAFTLAALVTLALGIGANSAIFSVVNGVLLESLPYRDAGRLHVLQMRYPDGARYFSLSAPDFMSIRAETHVFERVEAGNGALVTVTGIGDPREINASFVTHGMFEALGLRVALGRTFSAEENLPGRGNVAILSHGLWQNVFGGDPSVLGRTITASGRVSTIVGVASPEATMPDDATEAFFPLTMDQAFDAATMQGRRNEFLRVIARARDGLGDAEIAGDLARLAARLETAFPETNGGLGFTSVPLRESIVGDVKKPLLVLLGAVGFVLLVACANVANLLLARGSARHGELSVRAALGAGRARLIRQLITESLLLGTIGGVIGLALAYWSTQALVAARPADLPRLDAIGVDGTVIVFTLAAALGTGLVFGLVPAMQATNADLLRGLQESGRSGGGGRRMHRMRSALVVAELALAVVLLTGAGLLIRSFLALTDVNPGFQPGGAMAFRVSFQGPDYQNGDQVRTRVDQLFDRLRGLPGVTAVGATTVLPLGGGGAMLDFAVEGAPPPPPDVNQEIAVASVTPEYFTAIGTPLKRGRFFSNLDHAKAPRVALLNEAAARKWFPNQDPVGRTVLSGGPQTVVGIVGDVLQRNPGQPAIAQMFVPHQQRTNRTIRIVVRANGDPLALAPSVREQIRALDPSLPVAQVMPLEEMVRRSVARPRFYTSLLTLFAAVALVLSATGIFGVMSYSVAQQSKEIGIRIALGARSIDVLRSVVGRAVGLAAVGVLVGVTASFALGGILRSQLFGVTIFDPPTLATVMAVLLGCAFVASLLPAARAARIDPITTFKQT
ncbi:MAG TPA: ABC transporter permease [Vicinamibacterales bacterium]|nr:ABC transporter permease [Vicinamibacterales bacterium]